MLYTSTLDAVYVYVVPWSEFPFVPSYPHYPSSFFLTTLEPREHCVAAVGIGQKMILTRETRQKSATPPPKSKG